MTTQGGDDISPNLDGQMRPKSEPMDGPIEAGLDAPPAAPAENLFSAGLSAKISDSAKPREAFNREMYRIPSYAGWFSWGKIHTIERRALPEFFDGYSLSKTHKVYKEYREFMINKYRENPRRVLTFTEVRKMLVGDVNLLRKVFDFLEYWGLINHHIALENKQQQATTTEEKSLSNHFSGASDIKQHETIAKSTATTRLENNVQTMSEAMPPGVQIVHPGSGLGSSQAEKPAVRMLDQPSSIPLHKDVFASPATTSPTEDVGDSQNLAKANDWLGDWTMQEVLRLLEAIGKFGEDWNRVATHVGSKSKAECVLRFIKLPFGDQLVSDVGAIPPYPTSSGEAIENGSQVSRDGEHKASHVRTSPVDQNGVNENFGSDEVIDEPPSKRNRISPLADTSNPILAQVAFLSAMVGPRVAAAASQAAVAALAEEDPLSSQILHTSNQNAHAGYKDAAMLSSSQASSIKAEDAEGDDVLPGKGHHTQALKDVETVHGPLKEPVSSVTHVRAGIGTAIGAVAANTKLLVDHEEREIEHIMADIIENQLRKLQSKVEHYEELEFILEREHSQLEKARLQVLADWIRYSQYHYNSGPDSGPG
eukprot:c13958_g1_i1 orf=230-2011(+)